MGSNYNGNYLSICITVGLAFYTWTVIILKNEQDFKSYSRYSGYKKSNNFPFLATNTSEMKNKEIRFRGKQENVC